MTAKIKLNAASGGGSFSLQAPSSSANNRVLTLPDAADGIVAQTDSSGNFAVSGTTTCTGNLKAGTITDTSGNNSSTTAQIAQGRAKAYALFQGTGTVSLTNTFNVSSITDNGTGDYTLSFTNDLSSTNYCTFGSSEYGSSHIFVGGSHRTRNTGSCRMMYGTSGGAGAAGFVSDFAHCSFMAIGG